MTTQISRQSIVDLWVASTNEGKFEAVLSFLLEKLGNPPLSEDILKNLKSRVRTFCFHIQQKWSNSGRSKQCFYQYNSAWFQGTFHLPDCVIQAIKDKKSVNKSRPCKPVKPFAACVSKKVKSLVESTSPVDLSLATATNLQSEGKKDSSSIVNELAAGTTIKKARESLYQQQAKLSSDQALALIVDADLSRNQYNTIRQQAKDINSNMYPSYYKIRAAKEFCYPRGIIITEISAEVPLQSLIDHTVIRICKVVKDVLNALPLSENNDINIVIKWGCDGSEQTKYRQRFEGENCSDESLFSISIVPLQLYTGDDKCKTILWQNPATSSTRYCRPVKLIFEEESNQTITREVENVRGQIESLSPTKIIINGADCFVNPQLIFCMIDDKVCNAVSSCASMQTCYICGAKPSEMNRPTIVSQKIVNDEFLSFGLSPLHAWIRFFECILHISYRLEMKTWQVSGNENKEKLEQKKKLVHDGFRSEFGLSVDMPKEQAGNTNDGNTARCFFRNAKKSAEITGINVDLINRFRVILECLNSGYQIDVKKFDEYAMQTRSLYLKEYSWYPMPVSVHKVLYHGSQIISSCILPIGQMSEEAQEARNKNTRQYREFCTGKTSRFDTNTDMLNRLFISSDPYITSLRASPKTKCGIITKEVLNLLSTPSVL